MPVKNSEVIDDELWTAIENLDYNLVTKFEHIRNETEAMQFDNELEVVEMVEERLLKEFPKIFEGIDFEEAVSINYESFADPEHYEIWAGYAVYISFREDVSNRIYLNHIIKNPEKIIEFLDRSSR